MIYRERSRVVLEQKVTVLYCKTGWSSAEITNIVTKLNAIVRWIPEYSAFLVLDGRRDKEQIAEVISRGDFEIEIIDMVEEFDYPIQNYLSRFPSLTPE